MKLLQSGPEYFNYLFNAIDAAKTSMVVSMYIIELDSTGETFMARLQAKASQGVKICVLMDGYGSRRISAFRIAYWKACGMTVKKYRPRNPFSLRRLHSKYIIIDEREVIIGGMNIADRYHLGKPKRAINNIPVNEAPWIDYAVSFESEKVAKLLTRDHDFHALPDRSRAALRAQKFLQAFGYHKATETFGIFTNDHRREINEITLYHLSRFSEAKKSIVILGGYFCPSRKIMNELIDAACRGVQVHIVLSQKTDSWMHRLLRIGRPFILSLFGIKIYRYGHSILHAKMCIIDDETLCIGSYNLNPLSDLRSIETNIEIRDPEFARYVRNNFMPEADLIQSPA